MAFCFDTFDFYACSTYMPGDILAPSLENSSGN